MATKRKAVEIKTESEHKVSDDHCDEISYFNDVRAIVY